MEIIVGWRSVTLLPALTGQSIMEQKNSLDAMIFLLFSGVLVIFSA